MWVSHNDEEWARLRDLALLEILKRGDPTELEELRAEQAEPGRKVPPWERVALERAIARVGGGPDTPQSVPVCQR